MYRKCTYPKYFIYSDQVTHNLLFDNQKLKFWVTICGAIKESL